MFIKTISYKDFDGNERSEDFYFNLTQSEILKLETSLNGGLTSYMNLMVQKQSQPDIMNIFEKIIDAAYGIKSLDGRTFTKTPEALAEFKSTAAYDKFFMEIVWTKQKHPSSCSISCRMILTIRSRRPLNQEFTMMLH